MTITHISSVKNYTPAMAALREQCLNAIRIERLEYERRIQPFVDVLKQIENLTTETLVINELPSIKPKETP